VVIPDPADSTKSLLVDGQRAKGVELGVTGRLSKKWSIAGGYAYQEGRIKTTQSATVVAGARLAQLPRHTLSLWNRYDLDAHWGVGVGAIYRDAIFTSTDNTVTPPGFVRFDAAVFYRLTKNVRAQLNVENVFDRTYSAAAHSNNNITPGSPRALRMSVTTNF
jgi:catecholate siderophore receptor